MASGFGASSELLVFGNCNRCQGGVIKRGGWDYTLNCQGVEYRAVLIVGNLFFPWASDIGTQSVDFRGATELSFCL